MSAPIGTILLFAGEFDDATLAALSSQGWLPCNGAAYSCSSTDNPYYDLYQVIGYAYGYSIGNDSPAFNVPDYRGVFHRGVSGTSGRDPDADTRTAQGTGGSTGNAVGSMQEDQFRAHQHQYQKYGNNTHKVDKISGNKSLGTGSATKDTGNYGDSETRPVNQYVNFIIKYSSASDILPVGTVVPYAAEKDGLKEAEQNWLFCDGTAVMQSQFTALYGVIKDYYGAYPDVQKFLLPDYRGMFLRGVQGTRASSTGDPNADERTAPNSGESEVPVKGNSGNEVGSVQPYALLSHLHIYQYNNGSRSTAKTAVGFKAVSANSGDETESSGNAPAVGDGVTAGTETRPINMNMNFVIRSA